MAEPLDFFQFVDLKRTIEGSGALPDVAAVALPTVGGKPVLATPAPAPPGDELIAKAVTLSEPSDEELATARLFQQSKELVKSRAVEDQGYARSVLPKLQRLSGEKFYEGVIDAADDLKVAADPDFFNSGTAAATAFLNSATFGQLTRIQGAVGQLVGDRPYQDVVTEQADRARILQKKFPKSNFVGEVASYLIPGSPVKALFSTAARLGSRAAAPLIAKVVADPKLLTRIGKKLAAGTAVTAGERLTQTAATAASAAAAGAAGTGAVGAVAGLLGSDLEEPFQLDRAADVAVSNAAFGGALGALIPVGGAVAGGVARSVAPAVGRGARGASDLVARTFGQLSGTDPAVLRAARRAPEALRKAFGTQSEIGEDLVDFLQSEFAQLPEVQAAKRLLPQMGRVNASSLVRTLRTVTKGIDPAQDVEVAGLREWATRIEKMVGKNGRVSAERLWEIKETLQNSSKVAFGERQGLLGSRLKLASREARLLLEQASDGLTSEAGQTYVELMRKAAGKRNVLEYVGRKLGRTETIQRERAETFVTSLFGKNKSFLQARLSELDAIYGTDFLGRARLAHLAGQAGPGGTLPLLPQQTTGRSLLGSVVGTAVGSVLGPVGAAVGGATGAAASSPQIAARVVGASDAISGFVQRMVANPDALKRLAAIAEKRAASVPNRPPSLFGLGQGEVPGVTARQRAVSDRAQKQVALLRIPQEIRALAREVQTALVKDGPMSAASMVRVIADTPYFVGLVHHFEIEDRESRLAEARQAIQEATARGVAVQK